MAFFYKLTLVPITWAVAVSYTLLMTLLSEKTSHDHQGMLMGLTLTTMALAWTLTGFVTKFLFSVYNSAYCAFLVSIFILAAGLVLTGIYAFKESH